MQDFLFCPKTHTSAAQTQQFGGKQGLSAQLELKGPRLILDDLLSLKIRAAPKECAIRISLKKTHNKDEGKTSARFQTRVESSSHSLAAEYVAVAKAGCSRQAEITAGQGYCSASRQDMAALFQRGNPTLKRTL